METKEDLKIDWPSFVKWFNLTLQQYNSKCIVLKYLTKGKKAQVQRIVNEAGTKAILIDAVITMATSDFCNGRIKTKMYPNGFYGSFPWLTENDERIANLANGKHKSLPRQELSEEEQWQLEKEHRAMEREKRRAEAEEIIEKEREEHRLQREYDAAHAATPEEIERILAGNPLPKLKPTELTPHQRIFNKDI